MPEGKAKLRANLIASFFLGLVSIPVKKSNTKTAETIGKSCKTSSRLGLRTRTAHPLNPRPRPLSPYILLLFHNLISQWKENIHARSSAQCRGLKSHRTKMGRKTSRKQYKQVGEVFPFFGFPEETKSMAMECLCQHRPKRNILSTRARWRAYKWCWICWRQPSAKYDARSRVDERKTPEGHRKSGAA